MRELHEDGIHWEIVVGRESWGAFYAIFVPRQDSAGMREASLTGASYEEAYLEVEALDERALQDLYLRSTPKAMD